MNSLEIYNRLQRPYIEQIAANERHYLGERRRQFVPVDDPELQDCVAVAVARCGPWIRSRVRADLQLFLDSLLEG